MASINGVFRFFNRYVEIIKDLGSKDYILYGHDNLLPNKCLKYINDSGTAKLCAAKVAEYTEADGFVSDIESAKKVNKYQTGDDFLRDIALQVSVFKGFALLVKRNGFDIPVEAEVIAFEKIRRKKDGSGFYYNKNVGNSKYKESEWEFYPSFRINERGISTQYPQGEIAYFYIRSAENPYYPIPDYYAGIEDIITSAELSKMDLELALNGFMPSALLTIIGDPNQVVQGEDGKTNREVVENTLSHFSGAVKDNNGLSGRFSLGTLWAHNKDEVPVLQTFDAKAIIDASNTKRDAINRDVCRLFKVPPVLVGFSEATVLGNQQALSNSQKMLIDTVNSYQRFITESINEVFVGDWAISQKTPAAVADAQLLQSLTEDEKRRIFWGLEPTERPIPSEGERILEVLNGLSPLLATKVIDLIPKEKLLEALGLNTNQNVNNKNRT
jgi:hypothetical protein